MAKRMIGILASKENVIYVVADCPSDGASPIKIIADGNWKLQKGDRSEAYEVLHQQISDYLREHGIEEAIVKASAVMGRMSLKLGMLHTAEVRGVAIAASASIVSVRQIPKGVISRTFGDRKVDEYLEDDAFWAEHTEGIALRKMSREAAMLLVAARNT